LDILINNAGIMFYPKYQKTVDGHELTWQSNHLGIFYCFLKSLKIVVRSLLAPNFIKMKNIFLEKFFSTKIPFLITSLKI